MVERSRTHRGFAGTLTRSILGPHVPEGGDHERRRPAGGQRCGPAAVIGGLLLKYLDQVAYTCATRYADSYAVTLSVDRVVFREAIHVGELVTFDASAHYTGRTSMEIGIRVTTQGLRLGRVRHTNSCYFTMVAVDDDGRPVVVPRWEPTTPLQVRRHEAALHRRSLRIEMDRRKHEIKTTRSHQ